MGSYVAATIYLLEGNEMKNSQQIEDTEVPSMQLLANKGYILTFPSIWRENILSLSRIFCKSSEGICETPLSINTLMCYW